MAPSNLDKEVGVNVKTARISTHKIGPFKYDEAVENIKKFACALSNLELQGRFSIMPSPVSVGHGFYQIVLLDKRPDEPKPEDLTALNIRVAEAAGYASPGVRYYEAFGQRKTLGKWAEMVGVTRPTLKTRVDAGMTVEQAITDIALKKAARKSA